MSEWISVKDRLPFEFEDMERQYEDVTVIVCTRFGDVFPDKFKIKRGKTVAWRTFSCSDTIGYVTHWMPLYEPPK